MYRTFILVSFLAFLLTAQPSLAQFCPADTNGDARVDVGDLLNVINSWGFFGPPLPGPVPHPDVTGDWTVNVGDLLAVINAWGPCRAVFMLDEVALADEPDSERDDDAEAFMSWDYCIYQVTARNPGSALQIGDIVCVQCPDNWMNACPAFALATFGGVTGNPGALSTGVNIVPLNGFCQPCPATSRGKYRRTS